MSIWLWDAGNGLGVTDNDMRAKQAAEACIASGQATAARVERAVFVLARGTLTYDYERTGEGWRTRNRDSGIAWVRFSKPERAAS
jgi:hypothetical protein